MLLLLEKMFQVEKSCFRLLQFFKDCFISFRVVVLVLSDVFVCFKFSHVARLLSVGFYSF